MDLSLPDKSAYLLIGVGVVLLLNPLYIGMFQIDQNWHRYEASPVTFTDSGINGSGEIRVYDSDVACLNRQYRTCLLEYHVKQQGGISYPSSWAAGPGFGYEYAYLDGEFYQVLPPNNIAGNGTLRLQHLAREVALKEIATPLKETTSEIQNAVKTGQVTTNQPLSGAGELIRKGETYYVVYEAASQYSASGQSVETGLMIGGIAVGFWLVFKGQRRRVLRIMN
jgi:hypothetical protein